VGVASLPLWLCIPFFCVSGSSPSSAVLSLSVPQRIVQNHVNRYFPFSVVGLATKDIFKSELCTVSVRVKRAVEQFTNFSTVSQCLKFD
jgi:hypothetical protein